MVPPSAQSSHVMKIHAVWPEPAFTIALTWSTVIAFQRLVSAVPLLAWGDARKLWRYNHETLGSFLEVASVLNWVEGSCRLPLRPFEGIGSVSRSCSMRSLLFEAAWQEVDILKGRRVLDCR